jgi:DNA helicase-2/ATP-dependent DNA helicase PcrA
MHPAPTTPKLQLTAQQRAIVAHNAGPALVFAVAGAGKTTAMAQRIARLVAERVFPAPQILATTFNRSAAEELRDRLKQWPGSEKVDVRTLHSLGGAIIDTAHRRGYLPQIQKSAFARIDQAGDHLLNKALGLARSSKTSYADELNNFDRQEFQTILGIWKGQLAYADLAGARLPKLAQGIARQAVAPRGKAWYLALYQLYEEVRRDEGLITFDDQLMTGWEVLIRHPDLLAEWQARYRAVLVDEFQDVNQAQAEMLDLLTAPHRNYMAIGDDDQTIYEWRGADPGFILNFEQRYRAQIYFMTENFRCTAGQIVLANGVISHNRQRRVKALQLTQGFGGVTAVYAHADAERMGSAIAQQVLSAQQQGTKRKEIAVLVRVYAQTPPVEQALIALDIPYVVEGDLPFYMRPEVQALVDYCRLAFLEKQLATGDALAPEQAKQFGQSWRQVYWQPKRYISRELAQQIEAQVIRTGQPLRKTLRLFATQASASVGEKLTQLGDAIHWLADALPPGPNAAQPAAKILRELDDRLGYRRYLEEESGVPESGAARADTVTAFFDYAEGKGNLFTFLQMLRQLAARQPGKAGHRVQQNTEDKVTITTIFRAKGREWPVVIVPHCNEGFLPYKTADNIEEERRLLYVAITRARRDLHLHHIEKFEISPFLVQAQHGALLGAVRRLAVAAGKSPAEWTEEDQRAIAAYTEPLNLGSYFGDWAGWQEPQRQQAAGSMMAFFRRVAEQKLFGRFKLRPNFAELWRRLASGERASGHPAVAPSAGAKPIRSRPVPAAPAPGHSGAKTRRTAKQPDWASGMRVRHATWGVGTVISVLHTFSPPAVWVRFDERRGPKRFPADTAELRLDK